MKRLPIIILMAFVAMVASAMQYNLHLMKYLDGYFLYSYKTKHNFWQS